MIEMYHDYIVKEKQMENNVQVVKGTKFHLIIPIKGNESATDAMKHLAESLEKYLQRSGIKLPLYEFEYNGTGSFDNYTEKKVEQDGFSVIPMG